MSDSEKKRGKTFMPPVNANLANLKLPAKLDPSIAARIDTMIKEEIQQHTPIVKATLQDFAKVIGPLIVDRNLTPDRIDKIVDISEVLFEDTKSCGYRASSSILKSVCFSMKDKHMGEAEKLSLIDFVAQKMVGIMKVDMEGDEERIAAFVKEVQEHWTFE